MRVFWALAGQIYFCCLQLFITEMLVFSFNEEMKSCFEHIAVIFVPLTKSQLAGRDGVKGY